MRVVVGLIVSVGLVWACSPQAVTPSASGSSATSQVSEAPSSGASAAPSGSMSPAELDLLGGVREDAFVDCVAKREDLPAGAIGGVECAPRTALVDRIGFYRFETEQAAFEAYATRMAGQGIALRSGDCWSGTPGDSAWTPGDGPDHGGDIPYRAGCFFDEFGTANVRLTCTMAAAVGAGTYVGILGANRDVAALYEWALAYPEGAEIDVPTSPGICFNDALFLPD